MDERLIERTAVYRAAARENAPSGEHYRGLRIHACKGLHAHVAELLKLRINEGGRVLDIASGSGAMACRLQDMGFKVTACDAVTENFRPHGEIPFHTVNLDDDFCAKIDGSFNGVVAVEIIEHLENPRHFLRMCAHLLVADGVLLVTTPNIGNPASIASYIRDGTFMLFGEREYAQDGHITPVSGWQMRKMLEEAGFELELITSYGDPMQEIQGSWRLQVLSRAISALARVPVAERGEILIAIARRRRTEEE